MTSDLQTNGRGPNGAPAATALTDPGTVPMPLGVGASRLTFAQRVTVTAERLLWNRRAESWDVAGSTGLTKVVEAVVEACECPPGTLAVDLGCGSGQVTLPLASRCTSILALDVSGPSVDRMAAKAQAAGIDNIKGVAHPIETLELPAESVNLIVTNYTLHHLRDPDKVALLQRSFRWLQPGGQLVIGDMMFGRGATSEDRAIIASKVRGMIRRGPAGWWRVAKNVWRFSLRIREKPLAAARWEALVKQAGFEDVAVKHVVAEACVLTATRPQTEDGPPAPADGATASAEL